MWRPKETLSMPVTFSRLRNCITLKIVPSRTEVMWKLIPTQLTTQCHGSQPMLELYPANTGKSYGRHGSSFFPAKPASLRYGHQREWSYLPGSGNFHALCLQPELCRDSSTSR